MVLSGWRPSIPGRERRPGRRRRVPRLTAVVAAIGLAALPVTAAGSAWSALTYRQSWYPPFYAHASLCAQSAILDTATHNAQAVSMYYVAGACSGGNMGVPSGYLGTQIDAYGDGAYCGSTSISYNTSFTSSWQLWWSPCANPPGLQSFSTYGTAYGWTGSYYIGGGVWSPSQSY